MYHRAKEIWRRIQYRLLGGDERTARTKRNVLGMFLLRGMSQATGMLIVPLSLQCLPQTHYGIWLTLSSLIMWFGFLDIGLSNGLRNKLAEALAQGDLSLAKTYVSTTYAGITLISIGVLILYFLVSPFLNWIRILNAPPDLSTQLPWVANLTFSAFCFRLTLGTLNAILFAYQRPAFNSAIDLITNFVTLLYLWGLSIFQNGTLLTFSIGINFVSVLVPLIATYYFFTSRYHHIVPSFHFVNFSYWKKLINLGVRFFLLQIGYVLLYSTSNFLISHLFSPDDVVPYNIASKYYNLLAVAFSILLTPFWSAYTEAYMKHDIEWIRATLRRLHQAWGGLVFFVLVFTLFSNNFYKLWVGTKVSVPIGISLAMAFYVLVTTWSNIYANVINGIGKIQLQVYVSIIISLLNVPLAYFLGVHLRFGVVGVILAPSLCILITAFLWPIQVRKILANTATGIWGK